MGHVLLEKNKGRGSKSRNLRTAFDFDNQQHALKCLRVFRTKFREFQLLLGRVKTHHTLIIFTFFSPSDNIA